MPGRYELVMMYALSAVGVWQIRSWLQAWIDRWAIRKKQELAARYQGEKLIAQYEKGTGRKWEGQAMIEWLKRLFCRHEWRFHRNVYGDEFIAINWNRSVWFCNNCGAFKWEKSLFEERGA